MGEPVASMNFIDSNRYRRTTDNFLETKGKNR